MRRGIVYIGGADRHQLNQSATVVADRIARALQNKISRNCPPTYDIKIEKAAYQLAPDISLDIASIGFVKDENLVPVLDVFEVKYLSRFTQRFARLAPLARAAKAVCITARVCKVWVNNRLSRPAADVITADDPEETFTRLDRIQACWLNVTRMKTIGLAVYWLLVGTFAALAINVSFDNVLGFFKNDADRTWHVLLIAGIFIGAEAVRKTFIEKIDQSAVESWASVEYQLDDSRFLAVPNAILDAIAVAKQRNCATVDLMAFSLGSLLATDAIFPRQQRARVWSPPLAINNWITIGFPYDLIREVFPGYFSGRASPVVNFRQWINVVVQNDFLGTAFKHGDGRGIRVVGSAKVYAPDKPLQPIKPERHVEPDRLKDLFLLRRVSNHRIYWDDEDARAVTCFHEIVDEAGWTAELHAFLKTSRAPTN